MGRGSGGGRHGLETSQDLEGSLRGVFIRVVHFFSMEDPLWSEHLKEPVGLDVPVQVTSPPGQPRLQPVVGHPPCQRLLSESHALWPPWEGDVGLEAQGDFCDHSHVLWDLPSVGCWEPHLPTGETKGQHLICQEGGRVGLSWKIAPLPCWVLRRCKAFYSSANHLPMSAPSTPSLALRQGH